MKKIYLSLALIGCFQLMVTASSPLFQTDTISLEKNVFRQYLTLDQQATIIEVKNLTVGIMYHFSIFQLTNVACSPTVFIERQGILETENQAMSFIATATNEYISIASCAEFNETEIYINISEAFSSESLYETTRSSNSIQAFPNINIESLVQEVFLRGNCVNVSNVTYDGAVFALGEFENGTESIGIEEGLILSSGAVQLAGGPNTVSNTTANWGDASGDIDLERTGGTFIYDAAILEFDFVPTTDLLTFEYVFASEEYCEFVNVDFNDMFGFYVSGPGIQGTYSNGAINIAELPTTGEAVSINTVNHLINPEFYVDNVPVNQAQNVPCIDYPFTNPPSIALIEYDGFTTVLTATVAVQPCETYHMKIGVADATDDFYDSAVFLAARSFDAETSASLDVLVPNDTDNTVLEGEDTAMFKFTRRENTDINQDLIIPFQVSENSTATEGIDFETLPESITIPALETEFSLSVLTYADMLVEDTESIILELIVSPCVDTCAIVFEENALWIEDDSPECGDFSLQITTSDALCFGASNGFVTAEVSSGNPPYQYLWSNGMTTASIDNLESDVYMLTVTDEVGCMLIEEIVIDEYEAFDIVIEKEFSDCDAANGSISLLIFSGNDPYTFNWSNGATSSMIDNLAVGTYTVTITDTHDCTAERTIVIESSNSLTTSINAQATSCGLDNGSISLVPSLGTAPYAYDWSTGATTASIDNLASGTYEFTITDSQNCAINGTAEVAASTTIEATTEVQHTSCGAANGSINVSPESGSPPYTYVWSNGATTANLSNLEADMYELSISDSEDCRLEITAIILNSEVLSWSVNTQNTQCEQANGMIELIPVSGTPPYEYHWENGETTANLIDLEAGTYPFVIEDSQGCSVSGVVLIEASEAISLTAQVMPTSCGLDNGSIALNVLSGIAPYNYQWSNGADTPILTDVESGTYTCTITDAEGCTLSDMFVVESSETLEIVEFIENASCGLANGSLTLEVESGTAPYDYEWNTGASSSSLTDLEDGIYSYTVTDSEGCIAMNTIEIEATTGLEASFEVEHTNCGLANGAITVSNLSGVPPYIYEWSNGATMDAISDLEGNTYQVTITDSENCMLIEEISVETSLEISVSLEGETTTCGLNNGHLDFTVLGGTAPYQYVWSNNVDTLNLSNLSPGVYILTVTDANDCVAIAETEIEASVALTLGASVLPVSCEGGEDGAIDLEITSGTAPYTYEWNTTDTTEDLTNLSAGFYECIITDAENCTSTFSETIVEPEALLLLISSNPAIDGNTGTANIEISGGIPEYVISWSNGATTDTIFDLAAGIYEVSVTDANGCLATATVTVEQVTATENIATHQWTIYPNPVTQQQLYFNYEAYEAATIQVFDINGCLILEQMVFAPTTLIDLPDLPSGVYIFGVETIRSVGFEKLIVD